MTNHDTRDWSDYLLENEEASHAARHLYRDDLRVQRKLRLELIERAEEALAKAKADLAVPSMTGAEYGRALLGRTA